MPDPLKPHWFQILFSLAGGPLHGSSIMEEVLERTEGRMKLWPATLYGSLKDLEDAGWIRESPPGPDAPSEGGRRRFYVLTPVGKQALRAELGRMRAILDEARARNLLGTA
jgi:DNA-binding PadR family transcriptional regulator